MTDTDANASHAEALLKAGSGIRSDLAVIDQSPADAPAAVAAASATIRYAEAQLRLIRREAERLAERQRIFERASTTAGIGLWECRLRDEGLDWSQGVYDLFGIPRGAALRRAKILEHYTAASLRDLEAARTRAITERTGFRLDTEIRTAAGRLRWIRLTATVEARDGVAVRLFGFKQDVTEEKLAAAAARRHADLDAMTGLANRRPFEDRLAGLCRAGVGVLVLVDLDGFKAVNDGFGHAAGDACLKEAARRMAALCRRDDLLARIGGDEFAILLGGCETGVAETLADAIVRSVGRPMRVGGVTVQVGASVGIAGIAGGGAADAFARADAALYAAKAAGRNTVRRDGASTRIG